MQPRREPLDSRTRPECPSASVHSMSSISHMCRVTRRSSPFDLIDLLRFASLCLQESRAEPTEERTRSRCRSTWGGFAFGSGCGTDLRLGRNFRQKKRRSRVSYLTLPAFVLLSSGKGRSLSCWIALSRRLTKWHASFSSRLFFFFVVMASPVLFASVRVPSEILEFFPHPFRRPELLERTGPAQSRLAFGPRRCIRPFHPSLHPHQMHT